MALEGFSLSGINITHVFLYLYKTIVKLCFNIYSKNKVEAVSVLPPVNIRYTVLEETL
jgi:hypothetical protein